MAELLDRLKSVLADRYDIQPELGSGGMPHAFLAHAVKHDRSVALKVFRPEREQQIPFEDALQIYRRSSRCTAVIAPRSRLYRRSELKKPMPEVLPDRQSSEER